MKRKLLYALLVFVVLIAGVVVLDREIYRIHGVLVLGCETRPPEEVTALSGIEYGERILQVNLKRVEESVNRSPYYRVDGVRRVYPDVIEINVHERLPRAVVLHMGAYIVMDEEGYILEIRQDKGYAQCPMISGIQIVTYNVGQRVDSSDALQLRAMERVLLAMEAQGVGELVNQVYLDNPLEIRLTTVDGYRVLCGDMDDLDQKFGWLSVTLNRLREEGLYGGTIYLGANNASYAPYEQGDQTDEDGEPLWPADGEGLDGADGQALPGDVQVPPENGQDGVSDDPDNTDAPATPTPTDAGTPI